MGTDYATAARVTIPQAETLATRLEQHVKRLETACGLADSILPRFENEGKDPAVAAGASSWMLQAQNRVEELIRKLETLQAQIGQL